MTAPTDQFVEIATRTQEAFATAARTWVDTVGSVARSFAPTTLPDAPALPDVTVAVDRYFDFVQQVLNSQRAFATTVLSATTDAAQTAVTEAARAAQTVRTHAANATDTAVDSATEAVKVVGEKTAATARATRNAGGV